MSVASESASMAACCAGSGAHATMFSCIFVICATTFSGAMAQPSRQPVMAKRFERPLIMTVRSRMPSSDQMEACGTPS